VSSQNSLGRKAVKPVSTNLANAVKPVSVNHANEASTKERRMSAEPLELTGNLPL